MTEMIHVQSVIPVYENTCLENFKKSPEFSHHFQVFFYGKTRRCVLLLLELKKVHVMRICVLLLFHSHAILMIRNLVRIAKDWFVAENLPE